MRPIHKKGVIKALHVCLLIQLLVGCACSGFRSSSSGYTLSPVRPTSKPYSIKGKKYYPQPHYEYDETGIASYYGKRDGFHGKQTSTGEVFRETDLTAAHKTLPLPCVVKVTNLENGRSLLLKVNDRGPFVKGRIIDVSTKAARMLGFFQKGTAKVRVQSLVEESVAMQGTSKGYIPIVVASAENMHHVQTHSHPVVQRKPLINLKDLPLQQLLASTGQVSSEWIPDHKEPKQPQIKLENLPVQKMLAQNQDESYPILERKPEHVQNIRMVASSELPPLPERRPEWIWHEEEFHPPPQQKPTMVASAGNHLALPVSQNSEPGIFVQAGAFALAQNAEKLSHKLKSLTNEVPVRLNTVSSNQTPLYVVRLGPLDSSEGAESLVKIMAQAGHNDVQIIYE